MVRATFRIRSYARAGKGQFLYRAQQNGLSLRPQAAMLVQGFSGKSGVIAD